jgi:beta-galactosidase GanA
MPAWCARKYPETLAMEPNGHRVVWGVRKNNCFSSGTYRLLSERVTRAMAEHFKDTPNVIGWQTDNEFGHPFCHCPTCRQDFQDWLRQKYGTIEELNRAWGAHFWGHLYYRWDEIHIPVGVDTHNPSQCLDYQRYFSWQNVRFQRDQVTLLREACPKQHFITHNFMGLFPELNYFDLAKDLDHVSWDNYPVWGKPGMLYDAANIAKRFHKLAPYLEDTTVEAEVAMVYDYDSLWALRIRHGSNTETTAPPCSLFRISMEPPSRSAHSAAICKPYPVPRSPSVPAFEWCPIRPTSACRNTSEGKPAP